MVIYTTTYPTTYKLPPTRVARSLQPVRQRGAALVVSLLILLVMTLIGVTAMQTTVMEERMAGNLRNSNLAFQAAEAALREAEAYLAPLTAANQPTAVSACLTPPCTVWQPNQVASMDFGSLDRSWWEANAIPYGTNGSNGPLSNIAGQPYYVIEELDFISDSKVIPQSSTASGGTYVYRITAQGIGGDPNARAIVQSVITKHY